MESCENNVILMKVLKITDALRIPTFSKVGKECQNIYIIPSLNIERGEQNGKGDCSHKDKP